MNIFVLDKCPVKAAKAHCNVHCIKMILESSQMLCSVFWVNGLEAPYKLSHKNHPCSIWARTSRENYMWLIALGEALHDEYQYRYGAHKTHKSLAVIKWCKEAVDAIDFPESGLTPFVQAMPDEYKCIDPVRAYKQYYLNDKKHLLTYTRRKEPKWASENKTTLSLH